jgi:hypothetical protein
MKITGVSSGSVVSPFHQVVPAISGLTAISKLQLYSVILNFELLNNRLQVILFFPRDPHLVGVDLRFEHFT